MDAPFPKSPYGSVKMVVYFDTINLMENYMVVNELRSSYED
jgi:GDP-D-mannose dehydratase